MLDDESKKAFARMSDKSYEELLKKEALVPSTFDEKKAEKHPNQDLEYYYVNLSVLDSPKSDTASLEHPFYALHTRRNLKPVSYKKSIKKKDGSIVDQELRIYPSHYGMMNLRDKDIIIYAVSCLMDRKNRNLPIGQCVEFDLYKFFVATNRSSGGTGYRDFLTSLKRLSGCRISTTIESGGKRHDKEFGLLDTWETYTDNPNPPPKTTSETQCYSKRDEEKPALPRGRVRITLSNYLYQAIQGNDVLTLDRRYFLLSNLFERRLYELARKHCGHQSHFPIRLETLREKMGFTSDIYVFRHKIKEHEKRNSLPGYKLVYERKKDLVHFIRRREEQKRTKEEPQYTEILTEQPPTYDYQVETLPPVKETPQKKEEPQKETLEPQQVLPLSESRDEKNTAKKNPAASFEDVLSRFRWK
jgi:plasmid replication initiation protein